MLKILGLLVALLLVTILLIVIIGYSLPKDHVAAGNLTSTAAGRGFRVDFQFQRRTFVAGRCSAG
jgi:hypothetical protein